MVGSVETVCLIFFRRYLNEQSRMPQKFPLRRSVICVTTDKVSIVIYMKTILLITGLTAHGDVVQCKALVAGGSRVYCYFTDF